MSLPLFVEMDTITLSIAKMIVKRFFTENCKDPGQPENGGRIGDKFGHGSVVIFSCKNPSYFLVGASRITCKKGKWSDKTPSCEGWSVLSHFVIPVALCNNTCRTL